MQRHANMLNLSCEMLLALLDLADKQGPKNESG